MSDADDRLREITLSSETIYEGRVIDLRVDEVELPDGRRWLADFVDEPDRFEITIHGQGKVTYAGGGTSDVTPRRTRKFQPKPGQKFQWENVDLRSGKVIQSGQAEAHEHGLVTIPQVRFRSPSRLKIYAPD